MHVPVLCEEIMEILKVNNEGTYLDATFGWGGHTEAIFLRAPQAKVVAMDRDSETLKFAQQRFSKILNKNLFLMHGNFKDGVTDAFDGILIDLGFSSLQIDDPERGFSFQKEGPLDMRMDRTQKLTAAAIVNSWSEEDLAALFKTYGEEPFSKKISFRICKKRSEKPIETTTELSNLISISIPRRFQSKIHPATKVFQALRIEVNQELTGLGEALEKMVLSLKPGGRLAVISFHSLEDRIVKQSFYRFERPCTCPSDFPHCVCGKVALGVRITHKPIVPSDLEIQKNPRSRSAKLRVFERKNRDPRFRGDDNGGKS